MIFGGQNDGGLLKVGVAERERRGWAAKSNP